MPIGLSTVEMQRGSALILDITITGSENKVGKLSKLINIDNTAEVWFRFLPNIKELGSDTNLLPISILIRKHASVTDTTVNLNITCEALNYGKTLTCPEDLTFGKHIGHVQIPNSLRIIMIVNKKETVTFAKLYEDTDLTDFHLSTDEGSVAVHRTCLAMHSDMFMTMLIKKWKETTEGRIELKGVSLQTLQQLKQYLYLGTLPEDVRQLLLLAKCYLLDSLKQDCLMKLALTVSPESFYDLLEFASDNHVTELSHMLLQLATSDIVQAAHEINSKKKIIKDTSKSGPDSNS